jgi:hypothetical protein
LSSESQQERRPLSRQIFSRPGVDVLQQEKEREQKEECHQDLVIGGAPADRHGYPRVHRPKNGRDKSGHARSCDAPSDPREQSDIDELREKHPEPEWSCVDSENGREHQEIETLAQDASGSFGHWREHYLEEVARRVNR